MYRLLIADDEALEREGLEWIINRMMPGQFRIIHAENGRTAIERAEEHRPQIVMMDVNMPGIQGLEAIKEIQARSPDTKMVVVTAYDYFAYAKEALTLGVKEYIVKPAKREHVAETLQRLVQELEADKNRRTEELQLRDKVSLLEPLVENELALMFMADPILDFSAQQLSEWLDFPIDQGCSIVIAFPEHDKVLDKKKVYDVVRSFAKTLRSCIVSSLLDRHMAVFLRKEPETPFSEWGGEVRQYGTALRDLAERQLGQIASVGIGTVRAGAEGIRKSYFEAVFASAYYKSGGKVCHFEDLKEGGVSPGVGEVSTTGDEGHQAYVLSALQRIREKREQQTLTVLDKAERYIREKFTEELSLEEVAEYVHLNPHYFSKIFKQQVGESFIDFLTMLRIEKAKEYIEDDEMSLKEVCYLVGYKDPNYFSRVFKKVTGVTPTEYRSQRRSGE